MPTILQKSIKTNKLKINGKKGLAFLPAVSLIIFEIKLYSISEINCIFPGINFFSLVPNSSKIKICLNEIFQYFRHNRSHVIFKLFETFEHNMKINNVCTKNTGHV